MGNQFDAEVFATGRWGGRDWTERDLDEIAANHALLKGRGVDPFLKLGHNDQQPISGATDGQPSMGLVDNVRRVGGKLMATFRDVPSVVMAAVKKGLYRKVSSEVHLNWEATDYEKNLKSGAKGRVLKAVALLGAQHPEIKSLADLNTYLAGESSTGDALAFEFAEPLVVDGTQERGDGEVVSPALPSAAAIAEAVAAKLAEQWPTPTHPRNPSPAPDGAKEQPMTDQEKADLLAQFDERVAAATQPLQAQVTALSEAKTKAEGDLAAMAEKNERIEAENKRLAEQASLADAKRLATEAAQFAESRCTKDNLRLFPTQKSAASLLYARLDGADPIVTADEAKAAGLRKAEPYTARDLFAEFVDQHPHSALLANEQSRAQAPTGDSLEAVLADVAKEKGFNLSNYSERTEALLIVAQRRPDLAQAA
jgi:hypothetical protein